MSVLFRRLLLPAVLVLIALPEAQGQDQRPIPYPIEPSLQFQAAVEKGTRTRSGHPGEQYWTNYAEYQISATLTPGDNRLSGSQTVVYRNESPDELDRVLVNLYQNLHAEGAMRNRPAQVTGGMDLERVEVNGVEYREGNMRGAYMLSGTVMAIFLPTPIPSGGSIELGFEWSFEVPEAGAPRMGQDGDVYYLGYWYPQIAVYDDVRGWVADQYLGNGEFYMGFADYDVSLTVPEDWLVSATGDLVNRSEVLSDEIIRRIDGLAQDEVTTIVSAAERGTATQSGTDGMLTWRFTAENVRDFAFGTSQSYVWDATLAETEPGRTAVVHAFYRPDETTWQEAAEYGRFSIEFMSERFRPYPWPHMSIMEGIIGGGMEYPMITLIGGGRNERSLFSVTLHEIVHMWFPMLVNQDEKGFTWMDEGLTSYLTAEGSNAFWGDELAWMPERQYYYRLAGTDMEVEIKRHADLYPIGSPARTVAHYSKPAVAFHALRGMVGDERYDAALAEYFDRWAYKHPYPWDMFNAINDALGEDLDWFWRAMFYETWVHDLGLAGVNDDGDVVTIVVEDRGLVPMPATVRVTYDTGMMADQEIDVNVWLSGERSVELQFQGGGVERVEIDPDWYLPDIDRTNNVWEAGSAAASGG